MTLAEIIAGLRARASQTVPWTGEAVGELKRGASYAAAKENTLGVDTFWVGGKLRTASIDIARLLKIEDVVTAPATTDQPAETTAAPLAAAAPVIPSTASKPAPARARKAPARKAAAAHKAPARKAAASHKSNKAEEEVKEIA